MPMQRSLLCSVRCSGSPLSSTAGSRRVNVINDARSRSGLICSWARAFSAAELALRHQTARQQQTAPSDGKVLARHAPRADMSSLPSLAHGAPMGPECCLQAVKHARSACKDVESCRSGCNCTSSTGPAYFWQGLRSRWRALVDGQWSEQTALISYNACACSNATESPGAATRSEASLPLKLFCVDLSHF